MLPLDDIYKQQLQTIAGAIQESDELAYYLSEEEESYYEQLRENFEPEIELLYEKVAMENPLQIISLDQVLMHEAFEGLFLPRILGYSVLRGELNDQVKYARPQDHFKAVLMAICNSPNFEILKKRIGQSIQIGFALSSDIWITNLIAAIDNKRIRYFLQSQKLDKYRTPEGRLKGYLVYKKQFQHFNYMTAEFPSSVGELKVMTASLKEFLMYRIEKKLDNSSLLPFLRDFIKNSDFHPHEEYLQILCLYANFIGRSEEDRKHLGDYFNAVRAKVPGFAESWLRMLVDLGSGGRIIIDNEADANVSAVADRKVNDILSEYYTLMDMIHQRGYMQEETMEAVKVFVNKQAGLSTVNECVRMTIFSYFARLLNNLEVSDYHELFELSKIYTVYIKIFANEHFNQDVKKASMNYVEKLMLHFTDKRGKDYQDIKKFVSTTFVDLNFLKEKEVMEMFKTRRKKKA
ncbi:MAG: hypothetical protein RI973_785 [Bacteroidota bacterium]|jgi:hypothetical protein